MEGLLYQDTVSGPMKVAKIEPNGNHAAEAELVASAHADFIDAFNHDCKPEDIIVTTRTNCGILGITFSPRFEEAEIHRSAKSKLGMITVPANIQKLDEGISLNGSISENLIVPDTILGRVILANPTRRFESEEKRKIIEQIKEHYPQAAALLDAESGELSFANLREIAQLRKQGIDIEDLKAFLFGIKDKRLIDPIIEKTRLEKTVRRQFQQGDSFIAIYQGFAHDKALAVYGETTAVKPIGARTVYPREAAREQDFFTRLQILETMFLSDVKIPIDFYNMQKRVSIQGATPYKIDQAHVEKYGKLDREFVPSFPSTEIIFKLLERSPGGRKSALIRDTEDLKRALLGDQTLVRSFTPAKIISPVNSLAAMEREEATSIETLDPKSHAELQLLENGNKENEVSDGILFCKYFPDEAVLKRLDEHAHKIRAIVFQAPSYKKAESVKEGTDDKENPLEAHIFMGPLEFVGLRDFHKKYPHIKIIWSHTGSKRNLEFVDDGKLPMFAKPECIPYLEDPDTSVRVSFCGSSTVRDLDEAQIYAEEIGYVKVYDDYARSQNKKLVGINGGGPDVMDRNGKQLQELGAVSVASACDLGNAGQKRHSNWDAVLDSAGDDISFSLRENILLAGDIVHISPGGIGSIQEVFVILAQNKLGIHDKLLVLVGKAYWKPLVDQLITSGKENMIKAAYVKNLLLVDSPEEVQKIFEKSKDRVGFQAEREKLWQEVISGETSVNQLLEI